MIKYVLFIILFLPSYAFCEKEKKNGPSNEIEADSIRGDENYSIDRTYYKGAGNISITGTMTNGRPAGIWKYYYSNGNLRCYINYRNGHRYDTAIAYYKNGNIFSRYIYDTSHLSIAATFYKNGKLKLNSVRTGDTMRTNEFYESGNLKSKKVFADTNIVSAVFYDSNGNVFPNGDYIAGNGELFYYKGDTLESKVHYSNYLKNGAFTEFYSNGKIKEQGEYVYEKKSGEWNFYNAEGNLERMIDHTSGKTITYIKTDFNIDDIKLPDEEAEEITAYYLPDGIKSIMKYLTHNIKYPSIARENGLEGSVLMKFVINEFGLVKDIEVLKDRVGGGCAEEAERVIRSMSRWSPAFKDGFPVKVNYTLPVTFKLQ